MTQHQVAEILGISQSQVAKRLNGKIPFTLDDIQRLADFFGIDPAELLGGTRVGPRPDGGPTGGLAQRRSTLPKSWGTSSDNVARLLPGPSYPRPKAPLVPVAAVLGWAS